MNAARDCGIGLPDGRELLAIAFLDLIAWSEIGEKLLAVSDDGYNVLVGSTWQAPKLFHSYDRHPNVYDAKTNSHAAGRYQFMPASWRDPVAALGLADFSPISQDRGALWIIRYKRNAMPLVLAGRIEEAITACRLEWASFPAAGYGQHEHSMSAALDAYSHALELVRARATVAPASFRNVHGGVETTAPTTRKPD